MDNHYKYDPSAQLNGWNQLKPTDAIRDGDTVIHSGTLTWGSTTASSSKLFSGLYSALTIKVGHNIAQSQAECLSPSGIVSLMRTKAAGVLSQDQILERTYSLWRKKPNIKSPSALILPLPLP